MERTEDEARLGEHGEEGAVLVVLHRVDFCAALQSIPHLQAPPCHSRACCGTTHVHTPLHAAHSWQELDAFRSLKDSKLCILHC